jgi:hypothetical protein
VQAAVQDRVSSSVSTGLAPVRSPSRVWADMTDADDDGEPEASIDDAFGRTLFSRSALAAVECVSDTADAQGGLPCGATQEHTGHLPLAVMADDVDDEGPLVGPPVPSDTKFEDDPVSYAAIAALAAAEVSDASSECSSDSLFEAALDLFYDVYLPKCPRLASDSSAAAKDMQDRAFNSIYQDLKRRKKGIEKGGPLAQAVSSASAPSAAAAGPSASGSSSDSRARGARPPPLPTSPSQQYWRCAGRGGCGFYNTYRTWRCRRCRRRFGT